MNIGNLISGLIAALIATILAIVYEIWAQKLRLRAEIVINTLSWIENIHIHLQEWQVHTGGIYTDGKPFLTQDEYNMACRELKNKLLSRELQIRLALVYGKNSEEVKSFKALKEKLFEAMIILVDAKKETWDGTKKKIDEMFSQEIDPLWHRFEDKLLTKASSRLFLTK